MASTPVQKELGKIASDFRRYRILRALAFCWGALAIIGGALLLLYWFTDIVIPYAVPALLSLGVLSAIVVFIRGGRSSLALREIARQVENDDPKLNTLLLAAAEQEPDPKTGELNFLQLRVIGEALEANRKSPWSQKFHERLFWAQSTHLATLVACAIILMGLGFIVPPQRTLTITGNGFEVTPGNVSLEKGSALAIVAKFRGRSPSEVHLVYKTRSGAEQRLPMARSLNDPLFGVTLPNLQEDTTYRIAYGGEESGNFVASVFEFPQLKRADAELKYPEYTSLPPAKFDDTRRVTAVEGTAIDYDFFLNKPVRTARLIGTNDTQIVLTNASDNSVAYNAAFPLLESGAYKLELVDAEGRTNKHPADFVFVALPNHPPKLKFQAPRGDQRVSALQEVRFDANAEDDFGLADYGLAYTMAGSKTESISLAPSTNRSRGMLSKPHESHPFSWMLALEKLTAEPGQLVSYYLWADDLGPDGKPRRSESDMFFAEVRPFEEIFRQANSDSSSQQQQQQQQGGSPATELLDLQKEIITATWNLRRQNASKVSSNFKKDVAVVEESQETAIEKAEALTEEIQDDKMLKLVSTAVTSMKSAVEKLADAAKDNAPVPLPQALEFEQSAYQSLLKLQAREYQVSRSQSQSQSSQSRQQRAQQQLDQLELKEDENRYETQSQASPMQDQEQREALQVLNRLKELARRQQDMSDRIKELQSALSEAKTPEEKENLERMLKRLQEEQQQIVQDTDELRQRMSQPENQSRMAEAREQLDQTRQQSREASQQLENRELSQALSSSSRAQQQLEKLSDEFRKNTSKQFSEEMRQLRQDARDLEKKHEEIAEKLDEVEQPARRALSDEGPAQQALEELAKERAALTNLLANIRNVTEQSEAAEPLLSRQLYEALRKTSQANPEKALAEAQRAMEQNYLPRARQAHDQLDPTIKELKESVERAAENVLGNEADSLRFAENELRDLADRVQREIERGLAGTGGSSTNRGTNGAVALAQGRGNTNALSSMLDAASTNRTGSGRANNREGQNGESQTPGDRSQQSSNSQSGQQSEQQGSQQPSSGQTSGSQPGQGQRGQGEPGEQQGQRPGEGQQGEGQQPGQGQQGQAQQSQEQGQPQDGQQPGQQPGQGRGQGQGQGEGQPSENQQGQQALAQGQSQQRAQNPAENPGGGGGGPDSPTFMDRLRQGRNANRSGAGAGIEGPMTGREFTAWSDRLRDVEEILQTPGLRLDVARVREQARLWRAEQKRHSGEPQWNLLEEQVINPLRIVQSRVAEELARLGPREAVVPVDRDPVPQKYSDLVSRYYERLGSE